MRVVHVHPIQKEARAVVRRQVGVCVAVALLDHVIVPGLGPIGVVGVRGPVGHPREGLPAGRVHRQLSQPPQRLAGAEPIALRLAGHPLAGPAREPGPALAHARVVVADAHVAALGLRQVRFLGCVGLCEPGLARGAALLGAVRPQPPGIAGAGVGVLVAGALAVAGVEGLRLRVQHPGAARRLDHPVPAVPPVAVVAVPVAAAVPIVPVQFGRNSHRSDGLRRVVGPVLTVEPGNGGVVSLIDVGRHGGNRRRHVHVAFAVGVGRVAPAEP
mmetsp:Transcript_31541/g.52335  ORF Transcript_31541/g.52335 Transcript_31541/m.52335 type:complete len:272 (+) Transcript_31541:934-1749(+)